MTINYPVNSPKWLSIVGIGEDGLAGLSSIARILVDQAEIWVGGDRHLAMVKELENISSAHGSSAYASKAQPRQIIRWESPIATTIEQVLRYRGRSVCVLASGDPMCYGIGVTLGRRVAIDEMTIVPVPSAFSLACARLGWSLPEVEMLSLCGRDPALLHAVLYSGARLLILSAGAKTPAIVAEYLTQKGFGQSEITVLQRMGGTQERTIGGTAATWQQTEQQTDLADLNTIAVTCVADAGVTGLSRLAGLPDAAYHHDGQLTKREVRAITLAALAPLPGQLLWDVGAGCGSIGIEWMRSDRRCRAVAFEHNPKRLLYIADNAVALGVPSLKIVPGAAPEVLHTVSSTDRQPDAIFIGGGVTIAGVLEDCWQALRPGGRLVANAVTIESEQRLFQAQQVLGGELTRIAIQRTTAIGKFLGWQGLAPITQWVGVKR